MGYDYAFYIYIYIWGGGLWQSIGMWLLAKENCLKRMPFWPIAEITYSVAFHVCIDGKYQDPIHGWHRHQQSQKQSKKSLDDGGFDCLLRTTENTDLLVHHPSLVFSSSTPCLMEIRRLYPSSPQTALKREGCHTASHSTQFACPLANFPLQFGSTWQAFLQKTFKRTLSFSARIPFTSSVLKNH